MITARSRVTRAHEIARQVTDPELPMLTLADLGILRGVAMAADGTVVVTITPTYSGCPALATMRDDLRAALDAGGFPDARVQVTLAPPWSSDQITAEGRRKLADAGIAPPGPAPKRGSGPIPLRLGPPERVVPCPHCGSSDTELRSRFGATACRQLWRCRACAEPFEHVKEH